MDIICFSSNIIVVTWLYFDHFNYVENFYEMSDSINTVRFICLGLGLLAAMTIVARAYNKIIYKNIEFILGLRSKCK
jgi:hypothetical protein